MNDVFITRTGSFLPGHAVTNDEMEAVLGQVGDKPSRARRPILRSNGITSRHYAIDPTTGRATHTNAQLTAAAVTRLGIEGADVACLATGTSTPDQLLPEHAAMVHRELAWPGMETVSYSGICLAGAAALKRAWLSVRAGDARRAVATGSELVSPMLRGEHFQPELDHKVQALETRPEIAFEKDFLRWMLSDGAGAILMERTPAGPLSLRIDWIDLSSAAHEMPTCMYAGADKDTAGTLHGWLSYKQTEWQATSIFSIKQDVRLLNENIARVMADDLRMAIEKRQLRADDIDWFLPHMSSNYFRSAVVEALEQVGLPVPQERWFTNLATRGNTGSGAPYIMLDELFQSGRIKPGESVLMFVPESGRFSSGFVFMEAVAG